MGCLRSHGATCQRADHGSAADEGVVREGTGRHIPAIGGPERNKRQLQLHIGNAEMHFSEMDNPMISPRTHFALEVENWDECSPTLTRWALPTPALGRAPRRVAGQRKTSVGVSATTPVSTPPTFTTLTATASSWYTTRWD